MTIGGASFIAYSIPCFASNACYRSVGEIRRKNTSSLSRAWLVVDME